MTTMSRMWRGVMIAGVLAAWHPASLVAAAPLLTASDAPQPPAEPPAAPTPPEPPRPELRDLRESQRRAARRAIEARRVADKRAWSPAGEAPIVKQFKGGKGITLDLLNMAGDIVVTGGKGRDGTLTVVRRVRGAGRDAGEVLRDLDIVVSEHANRVAVRTSIPQGHRRDVEGRVRTDYEIALPPGTALELKNLQGDVRIVNVPGDVRVEAYAGDVVAEALSRVRMLRSMSGDVTLSRSTVNGDANLQTVSGNVIAQAVKATSLTLGSVSGSVRVRESSSERALVRTVSGDIEFAAALRPSGRYELRTHAGDIVVVAAGGPGFEFEANTLKGDVTADVPTEPVMPGMRQLRGSVGDGSAFFDLTTFTGDIRVRKSSR